MIKTGTMESQVSAAQFVKSRDFDVLFDSLFPGKDFTVLWADALRQDRQLPGETLTQEGHARFAAVREDVRSGKYAIVDLAIGGLP